MHSRRRGNYKVHVYGFDERQYAEQFLDILVFKAECSMPLVWIPINQTSYIKWDQIPTVMRSKGFQTQGLSDVVCQREIPQ